MLGYVSLLNRVKQSFSRKLREMKKGKDQLYILGLARLCKVLLGGSE
jgi:hypothetical protein